LIRFHVDGISSKCIANITWNASIEGGFLGHVNRQSQGLIVFIPLNETKAIRPFVLNPVHGFGPVTIHFTATPPYSQTLTVTANGILLGYFFLALKQ
jgi:hypothetical protein